MTAVSDIPKAYTPTGGWQGDMPSLILGDCTDGLAAGVPDLRGLWRAVEVTDDAGEPVPDEHPIRRHVERIEQAGNRVVITSAGIIHDMYVDGTYENGVNDVMAADFTTPIVVAATFEDGALVLRPRDLPGVEVHRSLVGDRLRWRYHTLFTATMERIDN